MEYIDGFRQPQAAASLRRRIEDVARQVLSQRSSVRIMEVCGTHTMAIAKNGIRGLLPEGVELLSGPGCPVCVTDAGFIDTAIELAEKGVIVVSFGDMLKVPGSKSTLAKCRSQGGDVRVVYSPMETLAIAKRNPEQEIAFLAIGFETTAAPVVSIVEAALNRNLQNVSLLTAFKLVPPALEALALDKDIRIDAFLLPAHVSAIIGARAYEPVLSKYRIPGVIAGFEPLDILFGLCGILDQLSLAEARVENQYSRVVKDEGNKRAQSIMEKYLQAIDAPWRGIGVIPKSGLALRQEYSCFDAEKRHGVEIKPGRVSSKCRCGDVLKGIIKPTECALFGRDCTTEHAIGPCMVSSEGSCSAYYKYSGEMR